MMKPMLSVILPVYNLENIILQTISETDAFLQSQSFFHKYELIVVDDGSSDDTAGVLNQILKDYDCLSLQIHAKNQGYGSALVTGIKAAKYNMVLLMDADGQFHARSLEKFFPYINEYDIITGYRYKRCDPIYRVLLGRIYTLFACVMFHLRLRDINCGFKLFRKDKFDFQDFNCHAGIFYTDFYMHAKIKGCQVKEVPVEHFPRKEGKQTGASILVIYEAIKDVFRLLFR
jgi:glycosyltransferase involved in cell wall biosynthesis